METKTIEQTVDFDASPHDIYEMLMDSDKHTQFTGAPAVISREVGGEFTAMGGGLSGKNVELAPGEKIVQSWRAQADYWPEGHFSTATFAMQEREGGGTVLKFTHTGVPAEGYDEISKGWHDYYWSKIGETLKG